MKAESEVKDVSKHIKLSTNFFHAHFVNITVVKYGSPNALFNEQLV